MKNDKIYSKVYAKKKRFQKIVNVFIYDKNCFNALKQYVLRYKQYLKCKKKLKDSFNILKQYCKQANIQPLRFNTAEKVLEENKKIQYYSKLKI